MAAAAAAAARAQDSRCEGERATAAASRQQVKRRGARTALVEGLVRDPVPGLQGRRSGW